MKTTTTRDVSADRLVNGDLVFSDLHCRYVRFVRWEDECWAAVADRNTGAELPDQVHLCMLRFGHA